MLTGQRGDDTGGEEEEGGRPLRNRPTRTNGYSGYDMDDGSEEGQSSSNEWQGGGDDEEEDNDFEGDDEGEVSGDDSVVNGQPPSLVVQLRYGKSKDAPTDLNSPGQEQRAKESAPQEGPPAGDVNRGGEQQPQGAAGNEAPDTAPEASVGSEFKMQVDVPPAAEQQPRSVDSAKELNGIANGAPEGSHFSLTPEAPIAQPTAVPSTKGTG